ncbi:MAG: DUF5103 domain-containing protein [Flavobacterium sp.]|nr:MAG: DUF5103 domain-containing protein [Flavobacterium sp.]
MLKFLLGGFLLITSVAFSQKVSEVQPPYNIKTVSFIQSGQVTVPIFQLTDSFQIEFDDLYGNEANYYYEIVHCNYDWTPSDLAKVEYLQGFDNQRIQDYTNSFNTLQLYSHYRLSFPNRLTQFKVTGNYLIRILNDNKDVVFSRKFILYEDQVQVPVQVKRARNVAVIDYMQNLDFAVKSNTILFQNPLKNVKVLLMQNGRFDNAITNVKPQYTLGNDLIYKYDSETQFWGGNEFLYFENKDIRAANNNVARIDAGKDNGIYGAFLYTNDARGNKPYTFAPDINGSFLVKNVGATNNAVEADYAWIYFSLAAPAFFGNKDIYVNGMFNNFAMNDENRMEYNEKRGVYEKAIMIKQGFTNFQYVIADKNGVVDNREAIDGNFSQTENNYIVLVYYRENNSRYDKVIGRGVASSVDITN